MHNLVLYFRERRRVWTKRRMIKLICNYHGIKFGQPFRFANQKSSAIYYIHQTEGLLKWEFNSLHKSKVSLDYLLSDECEVIKYL